MADERAHGSMTADIGRTVRWVIGILIVAAIVALAIDNRDDVRVGWVFGDGDAPGWIVLVAAAVGGALVGWLFTHRPHRHH